MKILISLLLVSFCGMDVYAHCDTLDGPVVSAARKALKSKNINYVLPWIQKKDEPEITTAFNKTLNVRLASSEAKDLADRYFFETLVRVHRAGEGAAFTGLKESSNELGPAIPAADKAIATGNLRPVTDMLNTVINDGLKRSFHQTVSLKNFGPDEVLKGREYVKNYVTFIHFVERLYESANVPAHGHFPELEVKKHETKIIL